MKLGRRGRAAGVGTKGERSARAREQAGLLSRGDVGQKSSFSGGLGSLVAVSVSSAAPCKVGPTALGWGHKAPILPCLRAPGGVFCRAKDADRQWPLRVLSALKVEVRIAWSPDVNRQLQPRSTPWRIHSQTSTAQEAAKPAVRGLGRICLWFGGTCHLAQGKHQPVISSNPSPCHPEEILCLSFSRRTSQ